MGIADHGCVIMVPAQNVIPAGIVMVGKERTSFLVTKTKIIAGDSTDKMAGCRAVKRDNARNNPPVTDHGG